MKAIILTSSRGTLIGHCMRYPWFREAIYAVVSDRNCKALDVAASWNVPTTLIEAQDNLSFSDTFLRHCRDADVDFVISIFGRLLQGELLTAYAKRIFNVHPSLLPSFPGLSSVERALNAGARFVGTTIHMVDETMDGGPIISQCAVPAPYGGDALMRHRLFVAQCKMLLQVTAWKLEGRIDVTGNEARVSGARFDTPTYSPALEHPDALDFDISYPPLSGPDGPWIGPCGGTSS